MRNAKKIALLLLSLVLLVGAFAVTALAEDGAATVVYPDGSEETVAVGTAITPKAFDANGLYYGEGNTLYKDDADAGWLFTVEGEAEALSNLTVTDAMAGKKIIASGADKVYYTNIVAGTSIAEYNTTGTGLFDLLSLPSPKGADIKLYADFSRKDTIVPRGYHSVANYLDLNGHTLTITGTNNFVFDVTAPAFCVYSSKPGAKIVAEKCGMFFRSNDDSFAYHTNYNAAANKDPNDDMEPLTQNCGTGSNVNKHMGAFYFGERATSASSSLVENGKNITVYCRTVTSQLYGSGSSCAILGGTFVQTGNSGEFVGINRASMTVKNASFVVTNAATVPMRPDSTKKFVGCTFVYTGAAPIPFTANATAGTFEKCNFVNILPSFSAANVYINCSFGLKGTLSAEDLDPSEGGTKYLAHDVSKSITVNGATYELNCALVNGTSEAFKLTLEGLPTEYWKVGTRPSFEPNAPVAVIDGKICSDPVYDYSAVSEISESGEIIANGAATVYLKYNTVGADAAFTYQVGDGEMQFVASLGTPEADGENFYAILNNLSNVKIKMYTDIVLTKGVLFGTTVEGKNNASSNGTQYTMQFLDVSGNVDWDLNGCKVTMAEGATPIKVAISDAGDHRFNVLHWIGKYTFKLYSSVPGGEYINNTSYSIFGADKYDKLAPSYVLGTSDPAVSGGENLTVTTKGAILQGYESSAAAYSPLKAYLTINGGTYVYSGSVALTRIGDANVVKNATIITTGAAKTVFLNHYYKTANLTLENITVIAKNNDTRLAASGGSDNVSTSAPKVHKISVTNAVLLGKGLKPQYNVITANVTYTVAGRILASDAGVLAVAYPTVPEGKQLAYAGVTVNGEDYVAMGYADASEAVAVTYETTGESALWFVGEDYKFVASKISATPMKIDGVWYYYVAPFWAATVDGASIELDAICDVANATKAVTIALAGDKAPLAFTYRVNGGDVQYVACAGSEEADGESFYNALNDKTNVAIVMYSNILLTKGVLFGTMNDATVVGKDENQKTYYIGLKTSGNVDWDLNGYKVTVSEDATPITVQMKANDNYISFKALHHIGTYTFRLYSSVEGGEYINNSPHAICGVSKYGEYAASYLFGTNDHSVNGGENLKVTTNGPIVRGYESGNAYLAPLRAHLYINGGTYVYNGSEAFALVSSDNKLYNATIVTTGEAKAVLVNHYYRACTTDINNLVVFANGARTMFVASGDMNGPTMQISASHKITVGNVTLIGDGLALAHNITNKDNAYTVNGKVMASNKGILDSVYPAAPAEKVLAFAGVEICGFKGILMSYENEADTVTVADAAGNEARWLAGEGYIFVATDPANAAMVKENGGWYYYTDPVWTATMNGAAIELDAICNAANAGKTVTLAVAGEKEILYYTVTVDGVTTYYCGDEAASAFKALLVPAAKTAYDVKFYNDFTYSVGSSSAVIGVKNGFVATYRFDLNGYKWTVQSSNAYAFNPKSVYTYIYSTEPGGVLDVSSAQGLFCVDDGGYFFVGEPSDICTSYGKNLTVLCKTVMVADAWSNGYAIYGGTFVQVEGASAKYFLRPMRTAPTVVRNATFIVRNVTYFMQSMRMGIHSSSADVVTNCSFISLNGKTQLFEPIGTPGFNIGSEKNPSYTKDKNTTFTYCNFYNVVNNTYSEITISYQNCRFSDASPEEQAKGFIAYTGAPETVKIGGKDYVFGAALLAADKVALVDFGFGITEYWAIGAVATHANAVIDGVFGYKFLPLEVKADENKATAQLAAIKPGVLNMNLALQSSIIFNLAVSDALKGATVKIGGSDAVAIEGAAALRFAIAPTVANQSVNVVITIGSNAHTIGMNIADYAKQIVANANYEQAHNLVYAMVDYVRAMTGDESFCGDLALAYEKKTLAAEASGNEGTLLESIAFRLDGTIAIAVQGENAVGKEVVLTLATGRIERATVGESGIVIFEDLYVNEFNGVMTLTVEGEVYTYSLANYLHGIGGESAAVQALYNYAFYAQEYVNFLSANKQ